MALRYRATLAVLVAGVAGCAAWTSGPGPSPTREVAGSVRVAYGRQVMVATADARATGVALQMLQRGGNAVDAFAAASFALAVVRPQSTGIGGGGFAVLHLTRTGSDPSDIAMDFRERAPAAATRELFLEPSLPRDAPRVGALSVAVPGFVAGVLALHERYGRLSRGEILAPAIELAERGFVVSDGLAAALRQAHAVLARDREAARVFLPGGRPLRAGDTLRQEDLGRTLRVIAEQGVPGFYSGSIAEALAREVQMRGGILAAEDLRVYRAAERPVVRAPYRDVEILAMPPPSAGGVLLVEMLHMLAAASARVRVSDAADRLHLLAEVMRRAYEDRARYLGDPDFVSMPLRELLSPEYAARRIADFDPDRAAVPGAEAPRPLRVPSTTHISALDAEGNAVAATETINAPFGSGIVASGTGVLLNNEMDDFATRPGESNLYGLPFSEANAIAPRKAPLSSMSPTVLLRGGAAYLVVGTPGGSTIITAVLQAILNVVDRGLDLPAAVAAPRVHHQAHPDVLYCEPGAVPEGVAAELLRKGHRLQELRRVGDVQAVMRLSSGLLVGVSDPRGEGRPGGY